MTNNKSYVYFFLFSISTLLLLQSFVTMNSSLFSPFIVFDAYSTMNSSEEDVVNRDDVETSSLPPSPPEILPPVANAGPDRTVESGETVELDGSKSYDPNNNSGDNDDVAPSPSLTYDWRQTRGPDVTLDDPSSATPEFTSPQVDEEAHLTFQLSVSNGDITSAPDSVDIFLNPSFMFDSPELEEDTEDFMFDSPELEPNQSVFQTISPTCDLDFIQSKSGKGVLTFITDQPFTQIYKITPNPYNEFTEEPLFFVNNDFFDCDASESIIVLDNLDYSWYTVEVIDQTNTNNSNSFDISINENFSFPIIHLLNKNFTPNLTYEPIPFQYIVWLNESVTTDSVEVSQDYSRNGLIKFVYDNPPGFVINLNVSGQLNDEMMFLNNVNNDPRVLGINQDLNGKIASLKYNNQTIPNSLERINANIINIANSYLQNDTFSGSELLNFSNVDIAILDTGISLNHSDLNVYRNVSFIDGVLTGDDDLGHGSHIAGIAAAKDNLMGIIGAAPGAKLWAIKVCDVNGNCPLSSQIQGIQYVNEHSDEIDIVNLSIENPTSDKLDDSIRESLSNGLIYIVAAGNSEINSTLTSPARIPEVITVSAISDSDGECGGRGNSTFVGPDDFVASFSNYGNTIDFAAPGVNVLSTYKGDGYAIDSGTSMAAPLVAGQAALYKSFYPNATSNDVYLALLNSSIPFFTACEGFNFGHFQDPQNKHTEPLVYSLNIPKSDSLKTRNQQ